MKTQPMDVVVGGAYVLSAIGTAVVTAVKPKGRGWYVEYRSLSNPEGGVARMGLEPFRRMAGINQREAA